MHPTGAETQRHNQGFIRGGRRGTFVTSGTFSTVFEDSHIVIIVKIM